MADDKQAVQENITIVLENTRTKKKKIIKAHNIITNKGDVYYAQLGAGEAVDDDFTHENAGLRLGTGSAAPEKTSGDVTTEASAGRMAVDAGYPKTDDDDGDNGDAGTKVVTWRYSYTTAQGNIENIRELAIVDNRTTPTAALCHALFDAAFTKTDSDTLKIFVNHSFLGVAST